MVFDPQKYLRSIKEYDKTSGDSLIGIGLKYNNSLNLSNFSPTSPSSILPRENTFEVILAKNFSDISSELLNYSQIMNESISDSHNPLDSVYIIDGDKREYGSSTTALSSSTFGGRGDLINAEIQKSLDYLKALIGSEVSSQGLTSFCKDIHDSIFSMLYGSNNLPEKYLYRDDSRINLFGSYNQLFADPSPSQNYISGLSFLSPFLSLKSFYYQLPSGIYSYSLREIFANGPIFINPNIFDSSSNYGESFTADLNLLSSYIDSILPNFISLSSKLKQIEVNCDEYGRYGGYEGLGNIQTQISNLLKLFFTRQTLALNGLDDKAIQTSSYTNLIQYLSNFNNVIKSNLLKISAYNKGGGEGFINSTRDNLRNLGNQIKSLVALLKTVGYRNNQIITDRSKIFGANSQAELSSQLRSFGFNNQEIQIISTSKQLSCAFTFLSTNYTPEDLYSYLKGGEIAELILYLSGKAGVQELFNFLLQSKIDSNASKDSILQLFRIIENVTDLTVIDNQYKYGRLLGAFVSVFPDALPLLTNSGVLSEEDFIYTLLIEKDYQPSIQPILDNISTTTSDKYASGSLLSFLSELGINNILEKDIRFSEITNSISLEKFIGYLTESSAYIDKSYVSSRLLNKFVGLSGKELNTILSGFGGKATTYLSGLLSGISGGSYEAKLAGLIHGALLGNPSLQISGVNRRKFVISEVNSVVPLEEIYNDLETISNNLISLSNSLEIIPIGSSDLPLEKNKINIYSINKPLDTINKATQVSIQTAPQIISDFLLQLSTTPPSPMPGLGGSAKISPTQQLSTLTPSQSRTISSILNRQNQSSSSTTLPTYSQSTSYIDSDLLKSWIKTNFSSIPNIIQTDPVSLNTSISTSSSISSIQNAITTRINDIFTHTIASPSLIPITISSQAKPNISSLSSNCKKLGTKESLCASTYGSAYGQVNYQVSRFSGRVDSLPVDRPLGTTSEQYVVTSSNSPGLNLLESLSNGKLKANDLEVNELTDSFAQTDDLPSIEFDSSIAENAFSQDSYSLDERKVISGLLDLSFLPQYIEKYSKSNRRVSNVFDCLNSQDITSQQLCFNYFKCLNFSPASNSDYLSYCPRSTPGGKNKPNV